MDREGAPSLIKEGYLVKKNHDRHCWKTRWFVLGEDNLCYFKKKDRQTLVGGIHLAGASVVFPVDGYEKRQGVFKLCAANGREVLLRAPTDENRGVWTHSIGAVIRALEGIHQQESSQVVKELSQKLNLSDLIGAMQDPDAGIPMTTCKIGNVEYTNCFSGAMLVSWMLRWSFAANRADSAALASELLRLAHLIVLQGPSRDQESGHTNNNTFVDADTVYYRFAHLSRKCSTQAMDSSAESSGSSAGEFSEGDFLDAKVTRGKNVKEGFLMKRGHLRKRWKSRRVLVREDPPTIEYYNTRKEQDEPLKILSLEGAAVLDVVEPESPAYLNALPKKRKHVFILRRADSSMVVLQAEDAHERREWIKAVHNAISSASATSTP